MGLTRLALALALTLGTAPVPRDGRVVVYSRLGLELELPELEGMEQELRPAGSAEVIGVWRGRFEGSDVTLRFHRLEAAFGRPGDVVDHVLAERRRRVALSALERTLLPAPVGNLAYGELLKAELRAAPGEELAGVWYGFGALLEQGAYLLEVDVQPAPAESFEEALLETLRGITYDGAVLAPEWTLADLRDLWRVQAPEGCREAVLSDLQDERSARKRVLRTEHYVVVSSGPVARRFGQALENAYRRLDRLVELEEIPGRRLLPVLLFSSAEELHAWCAARGASPEACASASAWVADGICATWYVAGEESALEPELIAQLLSERLGLGRRSPWLRAGLSGYLLFPRAELDATAERLASAGPGLLAGLLARGERGVDPHRQDLGPGDPGREDADSASREAALFIEFLLEGRVGKRSFPAFLRAAREVPAADATELDAVVRRVYGLSTAELEQRFAAYCAKR